MTKNTGPERLCLFSLTVDTYALLFFKCICFQLKDNCSTVLCWFLPYINMNQPQVLVSFFFKHFFCLFIWLCEILVAAWGIQFPDQGLNPGPLHWEHRVLATGPPEKSLIFFLKYSVFLTPVLSSLWFHDGNQAPSREKQVIDKRNTLGKKEQQSRDFPGSPGVKTLCSHCREHGFDPWLGNECHVLHHVAEKKIIKD